jgi:hypothetical protein
MSHLIKLLSIFQHTIFQKTEKPHKKFLTFTLEQSQAIFKNVTLRGSPMIFSALLYCDGIKYLENRTS